MKKFSDVKIILYNENHLKYKITGRILKAASETGKKIITYEDESHLGLLISSLKKNGFDSKEVLILKEFLGRKFQKCPGSNNVICCNYYLLNTCFNCFYNCTYCFLNSYLNSYGITQFVNLDDLGEIINDFTKEHPGILRVGTGEFTDSLMFDEVTGIAEDLISAIASNNRVFLEFKTKSANINHLADIKKKGNTVLAWTLNTDRNINLYESGGATLGERLNAAYQAQKAGFYTAFHFDPIIKYPDFIAEYSDVIEQMHKILLPGKTVWISMGCFRYSPGFKDIIKHKFPEEKLTLEEMFPGVDGKFRYISEERVFIFRELSERIKKFFPDTFIYLCMEDASVWFDVFKKEYCISEDLENDLSRHLQKML